MEMAWRVPRETPRCVRQERAHFSEICGGLCGFLQTLLHEPKRHLSPGNRFEDPDMRNDLRGVSGSSPRRSLLQVHSLLLPLR
jgi:hypothetical protein